MLLNTDYYTPAELSGFGRAALSDMQVNQFTLSRWLPNTQVDDLVYRFSSGGAGLLKAANYRGFDVEADLTGRTGVARTTGELPPISRKIRLSEYDRLRQRANPETSIGEAILSDAQIVVGEIAARFELARAEAIEKGEVTFPELGSGAINFGRKAEHTNVAPATAWTDTENSTPITDLLSWVETYAASNGGKVPGVILTSRQTFNLLLRSAEVRSLGATLAGSPTIVSQATLSNVLSSYGLPPVETHDGQIANADGSARRLFSASSVMLLPSGNTATADASPLAPVGADFTGTLLGVTMYGTPAESFNPDYGLAGGADQAGVFVGNFSTVDPEALWTLASAIGVPVMNNANLVLQAKAF